VFYGHGRSGAFRATSWFPPIIHTTVSHRRKLENKLAVEPRILGDFSVASVGVSPTELALSARSPIQWIFQHVANV
jgi:hypothetical protein